MDANSENGNMVAKRIIDCFEKIYKGPHIEIDYDIAEMESRTINVHRR